MVACSLNSDSDWFRRALTRLGSGLSLFLVSPLRLGISAAGSLPPTLPRKPENCSSDFTGLPRRSLSSHSKPLSFNVACLAQPEPAKQTHLITQTEFFSVISASILDNPGIISAFSRKICHNAIAGRILFAAFFPADPGYGSPGSGALHGVKPMDSSMQRGRLVAAEVAHA